MQLDDTLENYLRKVADFHGCHQKAPGIVIGCYMVEFALEQLGEVRGTLNAVVETRVCLSDCVQIMTGCTLGNKHLKLHEHLGKYACTLYDRDTKRGVRVSLDLRKIEAAGLKELRAFHTRTRDPRVLTDMAFRKASGQKVLDEFLTVKRGVLTCEPVRVNLPAKEAMLPSVPCTKCGEPFLTGTKAKICAACGGQAYYAAEAVAEEPVLAPAGSCE